MRFFCSESTDLCLSDLARGSYTNSNSVFSKDHRKKKSLDSFKTLHDTRVINFHTTKIEQENTCNSILEFLFGNSCRYEDERDCIFGIYNRDTRIVLYTKLVGRALRNFIIVINFYRV